MEFGVGRGDDFHWLLIKYRNYADGWDVTSLAFDIEYSTSLLAQPGKLTFKLLKDPDPKSTLKLENGMVVNFVHGNKPIFKGYIFTLDCDKKDFYTVTAYDSMRYLQNHDYKSIGEGEKTLRDVFSEICESLKIEYRIKGDAATNNKKLHKHNWIDKSAFEILSDCIEDMNVQSIAGRKYADNGQYLESDDKGGKRYNEVFASEINKENIPKKYFLRCVYGVLELNDIANIADESENIIIGTKSLLLDYKYELDIDKDTYNEVWFMRSQSGNKKKSDASEPDASEPDGWRERIKEGSASDADIRYAYNQWRNDKYTPGPKTLEEFEKLENSVLKGNGDMNPKGMIAMASDRLNENGTVSKWGLLRKIETVNEGYDKEKLEEYVKLVLDEYNRVRKRLSLEALGYDGLNAGSSFFFRLKKLGVNAERMYIISATHHYGAVYKMSLDVCTSEALTSIL